MDLMYFDGIGTLCVAMTELAEECGSVAIVADEYIVSEFFKWIADCVDHLGFITFDPYDYDGDYLIELEFDEDEEMTINIEPAISESGRYLAPSCNIIYMDRHVPEKCMTDIMNNEYNCGDLRFERFAIEEFEEMDCENCPERFECPEYVENCEDDITVSSNGNSIDVVRNSDGTLRGFTSSKNFIDKNGVHTSYSTNFFSDDVNAIKAAAASLGIKLD